MLPMVARRSVSAPKVDGLPAEFRFHDLRHYFAILLIAAGCDIKTVQARVRPGSAKRTLDTYGYLFPDADESTRAAVMLWVRRGWTRQAVELTNS
jgi:integrase